MRSDPKSVSVLELTNIEGGGTRIVVDVLGADGSTMQSVITFRAPEPALPLSHPADVATMALVAFVRVDIGTADDAVQEYLRSVS